MGSKLIDARQHAGLCVVMFQAALLQLIFSEGCAADEHPLQVDARVNAVGMEDVNEPPTPVASKKNGSRKRSAIEDQSRATVSIGNALHLCTRILDCPPT